MVLFSEMYVCELLGDPVVDRLQEPVGKVEDIIIVTGEVFPKVVGLLVKLNNSKQSSVILTGEIDSIGKQFVATKSPANRIVFTNLRPEEILLQRDIIDMQIVDTNGAHVIRINDLKLAKVNDEIRLIAADVGLKGLLRRIGLLSIAEFLLGAFGQSVPDTLIGWDHVEQLKTGRVQKNITIPRKHISELHPADIASVISQVHTDERAAIFSSLPEGAAAEALHELEPKIQAMLLLTIDSKKALAIIEKMPVDEVADVLGDLPPEKTEEFLRLMKVRKSTEVAKLLKHNEETAGGLMTTDFVTLPQNLNAEQTINKLRELQPNVDSAYYVYIIDELEHLVGVLTLRALIISQPETLVSDIMIKNIITVSPKMNQREVANIISKYNLLALPVVDKENRILGIITIDDVVDFIVPPISRRKRQMLG